ncbi:hypothetical protein KAM348_11840 [Aeromonas caviae]|uniref:Uncharacterized protein n=1 Tax=Aeromonas caviae TaxID=648 RepID=A0AAI9P9I8_AERCA|nr:hypothetical protein KAM345_030860 [Aeromonas caviae]GJA53761.1 hypothetical protein KAM348_11840 [Aeromonas caviae]
MSPVSITKVGKPGITQGQSNRAMQHSLSLTGKLPEQLDSFPGAKMAKWTTA